MTFLGCNDFTWISYGFSGPQKRQCCLFTCSFSFKQRHVHFKRTKTKPRFSMAVSRHIRLNQYSTRRVVDGSLKFIIFPGSLLPHWIALLWLSILRYFFVNYDKYNHLSENWNIKIKSIEKWPCMGRESNPSCPLTVFVVLAQSFTCHRYDIYITFTFLFI